MKNYLLILIVICLIIVPASADLAANNSHLVNLNHFNYTVNSTYFPDSLGRHTWTINGSPALDTAVKVLGNASYYGTSSNQWLQSTDNLSDFAFGYSNFTFMAFINGTLLSSNNAIFAAGYSNGAFTISTDANKKISVQVDNVGVIITSAFAMTTNTPYQLVVTRHGCTGAGTGTMDIYLNGVLNGSLTGGNAAYNFVSNTRSYIGATDGVNGYRGHLDELAVWNVSIPLADIYPLTQEIMINSPGTPITSSFTQNQTIGSFSPQAITFNDTSTGSPTTWNWSFGNQRNSTSQNPSSVYYTAGLYPTFLTVTNANGSSNTSYGSFNLTTDLTTFTKSWMQFNNATVIELLGNAWSQVNGAATTATQSEFGGQSLDLTTNTAYISTASSPALNFSTGDFELEFWIYPTTPHTGNIISRTAATGSSTTGGWAFYSSGTGTSGYSFWMGSVANVSPSFTIPSNQWSWIKIERQSGTIKIYNNGILNSTISQPGNYDTANPLYIGRSSGPVSEACYIDEFRMSISNSLDIGNDSSPYAQYNGNLFVNYVNINPYATLLYKSWPNPATPPIYNATGRNRTPQLTGFVNATNITFSTTFDSLHVKALGAIRNTTDYPDINIVSDVIDNVNGLETISIGRAAGITPATNATRINLCDQQMAYVNYTTDQTYNMFYGAANITDGQHSVTYPIVNFYSTPVTFGTWPDPVVSFSADNVTPFVGQTITFTDASTNYPNAWNWSFGDGSVSTLQNPTHSYSSTGLKTISLISYQYANTSITGNLTQTNYINVSVMPVSGFNRQDLVMSPFYTLTITFADSATNAPIPIVSVTDSAGNSFTTTNGTFIESYPFSTVVIYASATGYTSKSTSYVMDSDQVQTVQMIGATPTPVPNTNVIYQAQLYRLIFQNLIGSPLGGLSVTITPTNLTMNSNWTNQLIGISSSVDIQNGVLSGITGTDGSLGVPLLTPLGYFINVSGTAASGDAVNYSITEYPPSQGTDIIISLPTSKTGFIQITPTPAFITYNVFNRTISNTTQVLSVNYHDPTGATNLTIVTVINQSGSILNKTTYTGTAANNVVNNFTYISGTTSPPGDILEYGFSSYVSTAGGWNNITETIDFNNGSSLTGNAEYDGWVAIIIIVLVSSAFTASTVYIGTIGVGLMGLFFYATVKWFTPGVAGTVFIAACIFWIIIGVIGYLAKKSRSAF